MSDIKNALAYYATFIITTVKSFAALAADEIESLFVTIPVVTQTLAQP
jgi:hypothetical protein